MSKDAVSVATLLGSYAALLLLAGLIVEQTGRFLIYCLESAADIEVGKATGFVKEIHLEGVMALLKTVGPLLAITIICAVAATFAQTKFLFSAESIRPKFNRISPLQGFKRLFSLKSIVEAVKGIIKITILMVIIYISLKSLFPSFAKFLYIDVPTAGKHIFDGAMSMIRSIAIAFVVLAGIDFFYQKWDYERQIKMSKQEVKEEYKQMEGDPQVKGKIREIQRKMAQSRMMQQVPQSDVVIRNPTHFAVALRYKPGEDNAPVVMAIGRDSLALRIVQAAVENNVAVIENPPLARALYANVELNKEIPPEFYTDVAEVLVYIFKLNGKKEIVSAK